MALFAHRLTAAVMAFALSGSPAVASLCTALCLAGPATASAGGAAHAGHGHHESLASAVAPAAVAAPHAHHGHAASPQPIAGAVTPSPMDPSHARLVGTSDWCCVAGPVALAVSPGVERTDGQALALASTAVVPFRLAAPITTTAPPRSSVLPHAPARSPLALRI